MFNITSFTDLTTRMDGWVRSFGADPITALKGIDFKTVGIAGAVVVLAVLLIDLLGYLYAFFKGTSKSYIPYSRSFALAAADAWEDRSNNIIGSYFDPYAKRRSSEMTQNVLSQISDALRKYGTDIPDYVRRSDYYIQGYSPANYQLDSSSGIYQPAPTGGYYPSFPSVNYNPYKGTDVPRSGPISRHRNPEFVFE